MLRGPDQRRGVALAPRPQFPQGRAEVTPRLRGQALAIEAAPLGIEAALLEPGPVSSGALDDVTTYTLAGDPYARLLDGVAARTDQMMTPEEVAAGIADAAEAATLPLRIPLGRAAAEILSVRRTAPDDQPFVPGTPAAVRS